MKKFLIIGFLCSYNCFAATYKSVTVDADGVLYWPTNFFDTNSSLIPSSGVAQTNFDYTAITNAPWLTSTDTISSATSSVYSSLATNAITATNIAGQITLANLPDGILTNRDTKIWTNFGGGLYVTGAVCKIECGGANSLIVSNGYVGIGRAAAYNLDVTGSERVQSDLVTGGSLQAGTYVGLNSSKIYLNSPAKGSLSIGAGSGSLTNLYFIDAGGSIPSGTTNILLKQTVGTTPTLSILNTSNTGPADLIVSGQVTATNGQYYYISQTNSGVYTNVWQPLHTFASMMMYTTNTINGGANSYAIITNYTTARSNLMGCSLTSGVIQNTIAGFYHVAIHLSGIALDAGATIEGDLLLNGTEKNEVSFLTVFDPGTPRLKGMSAFGILYITNNTPITFQVKSSGANGLSIYRAQIEVMAP